MNKALRLTTVLAAGLTAGCVTINIYFPASAAEKAADSIIDEVWKTQKASQPAEPAKEKTP
jgi:hypothetical protein